MRVEAHRTGGRPALTMAETITVEHVGEVQVSVSAGTLDEVFAEVARFIAREAGRVSPEPNEWERVTVRARDRATLLADWANELIGRSEAAGCAYSEIRDVRITDAPDGSTVAAELCGYPVDRWASPLKAATYHNLSLERDGQRWRAVILFDV